MLLQGLFVPLTCPFDRDGKSFARKLEHNVRRYSLGPIAGMLALAPGGDASALTDAEADETLRIVAGAAAKEKVLIAGVACASVHAALGRAGAAADAGFDAILLAPPTDWASLVRRDDIRELLLFYQCVADASPLPVVLWSKAEAPSLKLPTGTVAELGLHRNVIGLVDADLTPERLRSLLEETAGIRREVTVTTIFEAVTRRMLVAPAETLPLPQALVSIGAATAVVPAQPALRVRSKAVGFQVLSAGPAHNMLAWLQGGVTGVVPPIAACAPQGCFEAYAAWKDGDPALASERGARLESAEALLTELGPAGVRYGCDWNGYFGGLPRLPRVPLTSQQRAQVERALGEVRN